MKRILFSLCTASLALAPFTVQAEGDGGDKPKEGKHHARMLEKFDTNKDGKLDDTEKAAAQAAREARKAEMLKKYDANGDGKLDDTEKAAAKAEWKKDHKKDDAAKPAETAPAS